MGARYSSEAVQRCKELYLLYNGGQHDRIETEMRREWPGWSKSNLQDKGKPTLKNGKPNPKFRQGWVSLYSWKGALELRALVSAEGALTSAQLLFLEIEGMRRMIKKEIDAKGYNALLKENKDLLYQHRDYCTLSTNALARLEKARDNLAGFTKFWNDLLNWMPGISEKALRELLKVSEQVIERAKAEYASTSAD